jgi:mitogen-activated protein kinase 1/3
MQQYKGINIFNLDLVYEEILLYHYKDFKEKYMDRLKNNQSIINHIVNNSNSKMIDPATDNDDDD